MRNPMAALRRLIKMALLAVLLAAGFTAAAQPAEFRVRRGLNLDTWTTWPDEQRWDDPAVMLPFPEWRKTLDAAGLARLKADGFDFVRMPVDPSVFLSAKTAALHDRLLAEVLASARLVNAAGLKVIVDLHLFPAGGNRAIGMSQVMDDPAMFERYVELVREVARLLADEDPAQVAFEPMNEPVTDCEGDGTPRWPQLQKQLFAAARASATRLTLVLTGACYSGPDRLVRIDIRDYSDDNLLWTFHSYAPFLLTHQGATWGDEFISYVTGLPFPLDSVPRVELDAAVEKIRARIRTDAPLLRRSGMLAYLDEQVALIDTRQKLEAAMAEPFDTVAAWATANGVAPADILLGEFGMIRQEWGQDFIVPAASRAAYYKDMIRLAEAKGFAWSMWSYGGAFGVVEAFGGRKAEPDVLEAVRGLSPAN